MYIHRYVGMQHAHVYLCLIRYDNKMSQCVARQALQNEEYMYVYIKQIYTCTNIYVYIGMYVYYPNN